MCVSSVARLAAPQRSEPRSDARCEAASRPKTTASAAHGEKKPLGLRKTWRYGAVCDPVSSYTPELGRMTGDAELDGNALLVRISSMSGLHREHFKTINAN